MFFSVKTSMQIGGKVYSPCICYPLPEILSLTVDKLVKEGKAYRYDKPVFFQNGKVIEKKEEEKIAPAKKVKKIKKEEDNIPDGISSPEEIADEGF